MPRRALLLLAFTTGSTLLYETTLVRLLSVALWYPVAYVALATAMLGFTAAAVLHVATRIGRLSLGAAGRLGAATIALGSLALYAATPALLVDPLGLELTAGALARGLVWLILMSAPCFGAGLVVTSCFAARPRSAPRLLAADLAGAAAGTLGFVAVVPWAGAAGALCLAAALATAGSTLVAEGRRVRIVAAACCAALLGLVPLVDDWLPAPVTPHKLMGRPGPSPLATRWSVSSRIDALPQGNDVVLVTDGGSAMSRLARRKDGAPVGLRAVVPALQTSGGTTLVVGAGGGGEVQAALHAGSRRVVALEIDQAAADMVQGELAARAGRLFDSPGVELHRAEARSWLAAHPESFDAIVAFHTISNAAYTTGAMTLAESYLLTVQALRLFLERLSPDGVLLITRPEPQLGRLVHMLALAWPYEGEPLAERLAVVSEEPTAPAFLAAVVVTRRPLDRARLEALHLRAMALPGGGGEHQAFYDAALAGREEAPPAAFTPSSLSAPTDDRPYFNLHRDWGSLSWADARAAFFVAGPARGRLEDLPIAQLAAILVLVELCVLAALLLVPAARKLRGAGAPRASLLAAGAAAAMGWGFMSCEVVLVQRAGLWVGDPGLAMALGIGLLLAGSAAGALTSHGRPVSPERAAAVAALAGVGLAVAAPWVSTLVAPWPAAVRSGCLAAVALLVGWPLGRPFPALLRRLENPGEVALAWAGNGAFGVLASVGTLLVASSLGLAATAGLAAAAYLAAALVCRTACKVTTPGAI